MKKKKIYEFIRINVGIMLMAFAYSFFLDPNKLVMGGVLGLGTIIKVITTFPSYLSILLLNIILLLIGLIVLGKEFFFKTLYGSLALPFFIYLLNLLYGLINNGVDPLISDKILVILFSALMMGIGLGMVMKEGATTGGMDILQKIANKYLHLPYSVSLFLFDGIIILIGCFITKDEGAFFNFHLLLYAIIYIYISGVVMDQIVFSGFRSRAVHIISDKSDAIKERIFKDFGRGVTEIPAVGGYTGEAKTKLICVLSGYEFYKLKAIINEIDPKAFYYVVRTNEVSGEGFSKADE